MARQTRTPPQDLWELIQALIELGIGIGLTIILLGVAFFFIKQLIWGLALVLLMITAPMKGV